MASVIKSFAITGVDGYLVEVETDLIYGQPVHIVSLGDTAIKEARERLQAAIVHSGYEFPKMKIVINLAPSDIKKRGSHFDLAMAIGLLAQSEQLRVVYLASRKCTKRQTKMYFRLPTSPEWNYWCNKASL
jgi:magnesium chelatase family protein